MGKLKTPDGLLNAIAANCFSELPISLAHAEVAGNLPQHHRDPFDRMLIAQALTEGLTLVSRDRIFERYGVAVLRV